MRSTLLTLISKARERRRVERMTRPELEAFKLDKFRRLVRYAAARSPYYARIARERGIDVDTCVPSDFPVLTKTELMANFDDIVTAEGVTKRAITDFLSTSKDPAELFRGKYRVVHTSGSSGEVGYFVYSEEDWLRGWSLGRRRRQPSRPRRKRGLRRFRLAFYGATDGHYAGVSAVKSLDRSFARLFVDVGIYEVNDPLPQSLEALNAFEPDFLIGYTTALKILAAKQREGLLRLNLIGIGASGEATTEADRALLERTFGCGVTNTYGSSEHLGMGVQFPGEREMVLYDDELIFEFFEDHSIVTNLFNYTLPLIRYRMADVLRPVDSDEHAPYLAIEALVGRNELQPVFVNDDGAQDFVSPHTINEIFVPGVNRFQLHWLGPNAFRFLVCLDPLLDEAARAVCRAALEDRLGEILARKRMTKVRFDVVAVDDLPVNPKTRKFQLVVDARESEPGGEAEPSRAMPSA
jgi:phenylacetate-CoA ligase